MKSPRRDVRWRGAVGGVLLLLAAPGAASAIEAWTSGLRMAPFGEVRVTMPVGTVATPAATVTRVVLLISDAAGPTAAEAALASSLAGQGTPVAGVSLPAYARGVASAKGRCAYAAAHFEALSQALQKQLALPRYLPPVLVGIGAGGSLAYAVLAESPPSTFAGAVSLGLCPTLKLGAPLCKQNHLALDVAASGTMTLAPASALGGVWVMVPGLDGACAAPGWIDRVPGAARLEPAAPSPAALAQALARLDRMAAPPPPAPTAARVADLPLIELPTPAGARDELAVIYSGDGGWAGLDRDVGAALVAAGVPVVGVSSLQYFWTRRTPDGAAADLERILRHYLAAWKRSRVVLVGYSAGADVLPFLAARLPADLRSRIAAVALLGPSPTASFEFHVAEWLGHDDDAAQPVAPEIAKLGGLRVLCFFGQDESDSLCPTLPRGAVRLFPEAGAHHFGGRYDVLAQTILEELSR